MSISVEMVRRLREETGAGMMDCKTALVEAKGEMEAAREVLRKKGLATAAKKASRTAADGAIATYLAPDGRMGVLVEVNCETDFVAKTPEFQAMVADIAQHVAEKAPADLTALLDQPFSKEPRLTVGQLVQERIALIKENMVLRRFARLELPAEVPGLVASYLHQGAKIGVVVELGAPSVEVARSADFLALAKDLAMQVAAASPAVALYVHKGEVPKDVLEKEKEIYRAQAAASGKPASVVEKIAEGKMKEYYSTFCLLEQAFIKEPKLNVGQILKPGVTVRRFVRYRVGDESGKSTQ